MENLKIVEYNESYAAKVADMWRRSSEGWNGGWADETEETVKKDHEARDYINAYLVEKDDEIVGYCKITTFPFDKNVMYVNTLNVRYDCHGKGIGKLLILKSLERTLELGYKKLDLYTWPGNTKSIPLYKKCGFVYEDRPDATYLMNFVPLITTHELFEDYFKEVDWYKCLQREINLNCNDLKKGNSKYFEYLWDNGDKKLRVNIEKKSKAINLIETEDYSIEIKVADQELIYGQNYKVNYELVNKSGKPLNIELKGEDDRNIKYAVSKSVDVVDKITLSEEFFVDKFEDILGRFEAHPSVLTHVTINGKTIDFKVGIEAKDPVTLSMERQREENYLNKKEELYLNITNNYKEEVEYSLTLKDNDNIQILNKEISFKLGSEEKTSVKVEYILKDFGIYSEPIQIKAKLSGGKEISFEQKCGIDLKGRGGSFGGKVENRYILSNGQYFLKTLNTNNLSLSRNYGRTEDLGLVVPMLGNPYSKEFMSKKVEEVTFSKEDDKVIMRSLFKSDDFLGISVVSVIKLASDGTFENYFEVTNNSDKDMDKEIKLRRPVYLNISESYIPYKNKIINLKETRMQWLRNYNIKEFTENWLMLLTGKNNIAVYWDKGLEVVNVDQSIGFIDNLGKMKSKQTVTTKSSYYALDKFRDWRELRDFVMEDGKSEELTEVYEVQAEINEGNPFVDKKFKVNIKNNLDKNLEGHFSVKSECKNFKYEEAFLKEEEKLINKEFDVTINGLQNIDKVNVNYTNGITLYKDSSYLFVKGENEIEAKTESTEGCKVKVVNNGVMTIKASADFSPNLYSLEYNNNEYLETSFPTPGPRMWFNPYFGGIGANIEGIDGKNIKNETIRAEVVTMKDNFNNQWKGIKTSLIIEKNPKLKGITLNQYYLMLPNVPVLLYLAEVDQNTGLFNNNINIYNFNFFKVNNDREGYLMCKNVRGEVQRHKFAQPCDESITINKSCRYDVNEYGIQGYAGINLEGYEVTLDKDNIFEYFQNTINVGNGEKKIAIKQFYILNKEYMEEDLLRNLDNIKF